MKIKMNMAWATLLSAIAGCGGGIVQAYIAKQVPIRESASPKDPPVEKIPWIIGGEDGIVPSRTGFGSWIGLKSDVAYRAETDGFLVVHNAGSPASQYVVLFTGPSPQQLKQRMRVRVDGYIGATLPVPKGEYWLAKRADDKGTLVVQWLPSGA